MQFCFSRISANESGMLNCRRCSSEIMRELLDRSWGDARSHERVDANINLGIVAQLIVRRQRFREFVGHAA